jgi:hypothetical protein
MTVSDLTTVTNQIQKFWGPLGVDEFVESTALARLVNRNFTDAQGRATTVNMKGDTVYVSELGIPTGETRTIGTDADVFNPEEMTLNRVAVQVTKRFVASYEFEDLVQIQSQIGDADSEVRMALMQSLAEQVNSYCYSLLSVSTSAPDHLLNGISDFNSAHMATLRKLAGAAKWPKDGNWWVLADPSYYSDIMDDTTMSSADFGGQDRPVISGQVAAPRFGFNVLEDNSDGLKALFQAGGNLGLSSAAVEDFAVAFHTKCMHLIIQEQPRFQISNLHSNKQFGFVISADLLGGGVLATNGNRKVIATYNS